jgi:hypothetical protein
MYAPDSLAGRPVPNINQTFVATQNDAVLAFQTGADGINSALWRAHATWHDCSRCLLAFCRPTVARPHIGLSLRYNTYVQLLNQAGFYCYEDGNPARTSPHLSIAQLVLGLD